MVQWATGSVVSHGTNLHYYRSGGSGPALVLVHGITDDGLCWSPVAEVLSGKYDVIMVDLLEMARSENPAWSEAELGPWADSKHRFSYRIAQIIDPLESVPEDFPALVGRIACPALLITADPERGAILADDDVAGLRELLPRLEVIKIRGAGHSIRREQFSDYMDAIRLFLAANAS